MGAHQNWGWDFRIEDKFTKFQMGNKNQDKKEIYEYIIR